MKNFDNFDRKSFRKEKLDSKKKDRKISSDMNDEYRLQKLNKQNIRRKIEEMREEEKWEDWEDEV